MNQKQMMAQQQKLLKALEQAEATFDAKLFEVTYKEYVTIKIYGSGTIKEISIADDLVDPEDKETMQDIIVEALNKALNDVSKGRQAAQENALPKQYRGMF